MADVEKYAELFRRLLPLGRAWENVKNSTLWKALSWELCRVEDRATYLLSTEIDPRTAVELLPDWKNLAGVPDECTQPDATGSDYRRQILQVISTHGIGGMSAAFFVALAEALGVTGVVISDTRRFLVGRGRVGEDLTNHSPPSNTFRVGQRVGGRLRIFGWAFYFKVRVPISQLTRFRVGEARVGERLVTIGNDLMESVLKKYRPAHTNIYFTFGG